MVCCVEEVKRELGRRDLKSVSFDLGTSCIILALVGKCTQLIPSYFLL